ncbi:hypothetical protein BJX63DRAFT_94484 [Aspergillus granulosus]|uniref:Uncharacterized protein n=1 Tax=Aspergillus granulosus TaxID=176169 RepID=A0ABR4HQS3_9EURO
MNGIHQHIPTEALKPTCVRAYGMDKNEFFSFKTRKEQLEELFFPYQFFFSGFHNYSVPVDSQHYFFFLLPAVPPRPSVDLALVIIIFCCPHTVWAFHSPSLIATVYDGTSISFVILRPVSYPFDRSQTSCSRFLNEGYRSLSVEFRVCLFFSPDTCSPRPCNYHTVFPR